MAQEFKCKDTDCDQKVRYEPVVVSRSLKSKPTSSPSAKKTVYLTCPNGHTFPYEVVSQGERSSS